MKTYALEAPPPPLAALVEEVKRGEDIVLTDHNCPVAKISSLVQAGGSNHQGTGSLKAGCLKGFWMASDFDEPLPDFREYIE
jgi:antitoxin (DNA-binding transcriptional repressor) of toxin-antitoxin stability system